LKIAIVILNWNGRDLLNKFLPSIVRYSNPEYCDIYVADNGSTDDSIAFVKANFSSIKIIDNQKNYGFAKGYNVALQNIKADIFALVNSDIEVTSNWLDPIISSFNTAKNIAIVQPKILDYKNKSKFEYAGAAGGFLDNYGYPFCRGRIFNTLEVDNGQYNDEIEVFWATGACMFIRSEVYYKLNGFDDNFFAHQEEIDLCWRAHNLGYKIKYNGLSTVYHVGGATLNNGSPKKTFLNFRNNLLMLIKNLPNNKVFLIVFIRLFLDGVAGIKFFLELKPLHTLAIIKAHFSVYVRLFNTLKKRKEIPNKTVKYYYTKGIVKQHFINKKKEFDKLS
jgi:GT2 family glycosyltransferase